MPILLDKEQEIFINAIKIYADYALKFPTMN